MLISTSSRIPPGRGNRIGIVFVQGRRTRFWQPKRIRNARHRVYLINPRHQLRQSIDAHRRRVEAVRPVGGRKVRHGLCATDQPIGPSQQCSRYTEQVVASIDEAVDGGAHSGPVRFQV